MSDEEFGEEAVQEARAMFKTLEWTFGMIEQSVRIPMMPDGDSTLKPDRYSDLMPDTIPI